MYKVISEFENYSINEDGFILSHYTGKERKAYKSGNYLVTKLRKNGKSYTTTIHRILARTFLDLDSFASTNEVDHIDGNTQNNSLTNLQVLTYEEHKAKTLASFKPRVYCKVCSVRLTSRNKSGLCTEHKYKSIPIEDIIYWVKTYSWVRASKELGLSDNALRKRYYNETGLDPKLIKNS